MVHCCKKDVKSCETNREEECSLSLKDAQSLLSEYCFLPSKSQKSCDLTSAFICPTKKKPIKTEWDNSDDKLNKYLCSDLSSLDTGSIINVANENPESLYLYSYPHVLTYSTLAKSYSKQLAEQSNAKESQVSLPEERTSLLNCGGKNGQTEAYPRASMSYH